MFLKLPQHRKKPTIPKEKKAFSTSLQGSMTVEAAIILPLFLFLFVNMASSIEMIRFHSNMSMALWNVGMQTTTFGGLATAPVRQLDKPGHSASSREAAKNVDADAQNELLETLGNLLITYGYVRSRIIDYLGRDYLEKAPLENGAASIALWESEVIGNNDIVDLKVTYAVAPPIAFPGLFHFRMTNRYYGHLWNGYGTTGSQNTSEEETQIVYVTEGSEVYHLSEECTHLKLSIRMVSGEELSLSRNNSGSRYKPCEFCGKESVGTGDMVFIGPEGDKYHMNRNCSGLKRSFKAINKKEVEGNLRLCSRCGKAL